MLTNFTAAPHRVMFFGVALQSLAVMLWWLIELVMRYGIVGHPLIWTIAPSAAHIYLMIYGLFPFFMFGFLMTVFPRWMKGREITAQYYVPAFAGVAHRMIPFFTSSALPNHVVKRPYWPWRVMLAASVVHGLLQLANLSGWLWLSDAPLAIAVLYLSCCWGLIRSLRTPLLGVLHIGFAWMGIAMLLFTIQSFLLFFSDGTTLVWRLASLHALTIGCFATLLIGMATRVTIGHSGLPMKVDRPIKLMFAGIQLVALLRVLADILPMQASNSLYVASAAVWLACFSPWVLRYLPVYWRPRADGREG